MARRYFLITILLSIGFAAGLVLTGRMRTADQAHATPASRQDERPDGAAEVAAQVGRGAPGAQALPDLTGAAQRAIESVPNISSTQIVRAQSPFANDPFFRFFFEDDPFGYRQRREQSLGSGVVVSPDGYVLTNNHVVGNARAAVTVLLPDKREMRAQIVGVDEDTDIAVLKVDARNLPTLPWGDSSKLRVAEWVLAVGNPFGMLSQTVTLGIVSATGRSLEGRLATYEDFIQTDAAINRGNSGGALINARGELVGINTAIFSETGGYQGIGFAVPSNLVRHVMDELIKYGEVRRGTITGIQLAPMTTRYAEDLGAPNTKGVLVVRLSERSEAYRTGVRVGDIIVSFDGTPVEDSSHFMRLLSDAPIGGTVTLGLFREGRTVTARVPIVQRSRGVRGQSR
jgi:Do/DeqQ family serine protease